MEKIIAGKPITVNEEGYLTDFNQWDETDWRSTGR